MRTLVCLIVALAAAVAPAHAATSRTQVAIQVATAKWGVPCAGDVVYGWGATTAPNAGEASWQFFADRPAFFFNCRIVIDQTRAQQWRDKSFATYCSILTHEVGHLAGQDHSENPRSIMAAVITVQWRHCVTAARSHGWN